MVAKESIPKDYFKAYGIADLIQEDQQASFIFMGDVAQLIEKLHQLAVSDIFIQEPTLEEIFLHYYE